MKQVFTFIVLLCHINFTMFFPTVEEHDVYSGNGAMIDEVNSVYEYVDEVLLGDKDDTPEDEDDDEPDFYQVIKIGDYYFHDLSTQLKCSSLATYSKISYPNYLQDKLLALSYDIVAPPPQV